MGEAQFPALVPKYGPQPVVLGYEEPAPANRHECSCLALAAEKSSQGIFCFYLFPNDLSLPPPRKRFLHHPYSRSLKVSDLPQLEFVAGLRR
jgi:hypothetical protein